MNCADNHINKEKISNAISYLNLTGWSCRQFGSIILADKAADTFDDIDDLSELMFQTLIMEDMTVFDADLNMLDHPGECDIIYLKCSDKDNDVMMVRKNDSNGKEQTYLTDFKGHELFLDKYMPEFNKNEKHFRYITGDFDTVFADNNHYIIIELNPVSQDVTDHEDMKRHILLDLKNFKVLYSPLDYNAETFETNKNRQDMGIEVPESYYFIELNDSIKLGESVRIADEVYRDDFDKIRIGIVFSGGKYFEFNKKDQKLVKNQRYNNFNALMNELRPVVYNYTKNMNGMPVLALKQSFEHAGYVDKMINIFKFTGDMHSTSIRTSELIESSISNKYNTIQCDKSSTARAINGLVLLTVKDQLASYRSSLFLNRIFNESGEEIAIQGDKPSTKRSSYELLANVEDADKFKELRCIASSLSGGSMMAWEDPEKGIDVVFARTFNRFIVLDVKRDSQRKIIGLSVRQDIQSGMSNQIIDYYTDINNWDVWACAVTKEDSNHVFNIIQSINIRTAERYNGVCKKTSCITPSGEIAFKFELKNGVCLINKTTDASGQVIDGYNVHNLLRQTSDMLVLDRQTIKEVNEEAADMNKKERARNKQNERVEKIIKQVRENNRK